jgi:hypothetical protein
MWITQGFFCPNQESSMDIYLTKRKTLTGELVTLFLGVLALLLTGLSGQILPQLTGIRSGRGAVLTGVKGSCNKYQEIPEVLPANQFAVSTQPACEFYQSIIVPFLWQDFETCPGAILGKTSQLVYIRLVLLSSNDLVVENEVSPVDRAAIVGSQLDSQDVLITTCGNIAVIGMLCVFVIYPLGYFRLLFNRFLALSHALIRIMVDSRQCHPFFPDLGMKHLINRTCHRRKRVCSVSQSCAACEAITAARSALQGQPLIESPSVAVLAPGGVVGSTVKIRVSARIPLFLPGGNTLGLERLTSVQAEATFRQEGW